MDRGRGVAETRRGGRRKGSGKRADATAPWALRAIQALSEGSRWSIVRYLSQDEWTVGAIARGLGLSVACTSKHLSILSEAGLVDLRRVGRETHCRLVPEGTEGADLLRLLGLAASAAEPAAAGPRRPRPRSREDGVAPSETPGPRLRPMAAPELEAPARPPVRRYPTNDFDDFPA
jgi:DNA-binding transcriptional ArsR family regulator